ncbi:MAG: DNA polymerase III subunit gamma/tau [Planctomycetota bacterium]
MSYTVLARKFRSQTFNEVVGQSAVVTTLGNAITQSRVHHGYLFTGTRGVGKTSMARILAKCLNCLSADAPTMTPCGTCDSCIGVARGEDVDVVEIDAASNTGVDNIRELRSNAVYRPARARFKIYIIDEVHMLSTGAFNALLKTLEEPPEHVKFILATTEVQKVPQTILSRVQRFDFKSISPADIATQLAMICKQENVEAEEDALRRVARLANGSMRDALSLLDQALSMGGNRLTADVVNELFPATHDEQFAELIDRLADSDAAGALGLVDATLSQGHTMDYWCSRLISQLRDLMILRVCGENTDLVDAPTGIRPKLVAQAQRFDSGAFVYMITVLEELRRNVRSSGSGRALVDAAVIRLAEAAKFSSIESLIAQLDGAPPTQPTTAPRATSPQTSRPAIPPARSQSTPLPPPQRTTARPQAAAPAEQASGMGRRVTQADLKAAHAEPVVKAALEVFGGRIVDVQRGTKPAEE